MEQQNTKICSNCSTVNSADFNYCKNCGTQLYSQTNDRYSDGVTPAYVPPYYRQQDCIYQNGNIDHDEMSAFIGKNAQGYINKFCTKKQLSKKTDWNWAVFVLAVLLGPAGIAFWFFYRKMYKPAFLFLAVATVLSGFLFYTDIITPLNHLITSGVMKDLYDAINNNNAQLINSVLLQATDSFTNASSPLSLIPSTVEMVLAVVMPAFANGIYEKHAIAKLSIMQKSDDKQYDLIIAKKLGGTSTTAVVLSVLIFYAVIFFAQSVAIFMLIFSII